jgi:hypothetical protein
MLQVRIGIIFRLYTQWSLTDLHQNSPGAQLAIVTDDEISSLISEHGHMVSRVHMSRTHVDSLI